MMKHTRHEKPLVVKDENGKKIVNPNEITVNQHVIPNKHLLEWSVDGSAVKVFDKESREVKSFLTRNPYFCVMRLWDQFSESEMLKSNEDNYQKQISLMKDGGAFTHIEYIKAYYVMLCTRTHFAYKERPSQESIFDNTDQDYNCNKSQLEESELEMKGVAHIIASTTDENSQYLSRQIVKICMSMSFIQGCEFMKNSEWVLFEGRGRKFVISDAFYNNSREGFHVMPLNPSIAIIDKRTYNRLKSRGLLSVGFINLMMIKNCVKYYVIP